MDPSGPTTPPTDPPPAEPPVAGPTMVELPAPPTTPFGAPAPFGAPMPAPKSRQKLVLIAIVVVALLIGIGVAVSPRQTSFPDTLIGLPRLRTEEAQVAEHSLASIHIGSVTIQGAIYGSGAPQLMVAKYQHIPDNGRTPQDVLQGAAGGIIGSGGSVDMTQASPLTKDGVDYMCAPYVGAMLPSSPADEHGVVCVWKAGTDVGFVMSTQWQDPVTATSQAASVHDALK